MIITDEFVEICKNGAILLGTYTILDTICEYISQKRINNSHYIQGIALGLSAIIIQISGIRSENGTLIDTSNILISCSFVFLSKKTIAVSIITSFAFWLYADSKLDPALVIPTISCFACGYAWKKAHEKYKKKITLLYFFTLGLSITTIEFIETVIILNINSINSIKTFGVNIFLIQPLASILLGTLILYRIKSNKNSEELINNEIRFRKIVETSLEGIWSINNLKKTKYINDRMLNMLGISREELPDNGFDDFIHKDEIEDHHEQMHLLDRGITNTYERRLLKKNGDTLWTLVSPSAFLDDTGSFAGAFAMFTDISRLKNMEEELRRSEEAFRSMVEASPLATVLVNKDTNKIAFINYTFTQILGYTIDDIPTLKDWWTAAYPDQQYRESMIDLWHNTIETKQPQTTKERYESHVTCKSGEVKTIIWGGTTSTEGWVIYGADITLQKNAEKRLEQSEEKFSKFFKMIPYSALIVQVNTWTIIESNAAQSSLSGYSRDEVVGKTTIDLDLWGIPEQRNDFLSIIHRNGFAVDYEMVLKRKDKTLRDVSLSAQRMLINGEDCIVILGRDVTDINTTRHKIIQTDKMVTLGSLAAGVAHEINNPLGIIMQAANGIIRRIDLNLDANIKVANSIDIDLEKLNKYLHERNITQYIQAIKESTARAAITVKSMLSFSRRSDSRMQPANIENIVKNAISLAEKDYDLKREYDFRRITVNISIPQPLPMTLCASNEIEQVVLNLLRNAAQAMAESNTKSPKIDIEVSPQEDWVVIKVADNGPGIPPNVTNKIFEPFFSTKQADRGTGLGLSVSYYIVCSLHGGKMTVASPPSGGTLFTISLPRSSPPTQ